MGGRAGWRRGGMDERANERRAAERRPDQDTGKEGRVVLPRAHHVSWESHHLRRAWRLGVCHREAFQGQRFREYERKNVKYYTISTFRVSCLQDAIDRLSREIFIVFRCCCETLNVMAYRFE